MAVEMYYDDDADLSIVQGRKVRNEIDARPGMYAGRGLASAGIITGTSGVVLGSLVIVIFVLAGIFGAYS